MLHNYLTSYLFNLANRMKEIDTYKESWGEEFCKSQYHVHLNAFTANVKILTKDVDWENLTATKAKSFGLSKLCSANSIKKGIFPKECKNLYLFPLFLIDVIPEGTMVTNINGESFKFERATCDTDIRFGYLSFGVIVK